MYFFRPLFSVFISILALSSYAGTSDQFWRYLDIERTMSLNFSVETMGDLCAYEENFSRSSSQLRREFINEATQLMQAGAYGAEALDMVLAFDDRVYDKRQLAKRHIGKTLAAFFNTGLNDINQGFEQRGGTPLITFVDGGAEFSLHFRWGTTADCNLYNILDITNNVTGITKSFSISGSVAHIYQMGYQLAAKVFHSLHYTRFPIAYQPKYGTKKIFYHPQVFNQSAYKTVQQKVNYAKKVCANQGRMKGKTIRLTTADELELISSLPQYLGGIDLPSRKSGFVVLSNENSGSGLIYNSEHFQGARYTSGDISLKFEYICVEVLN